MEMKMNINNSVKNKYYPKKTIDNNALNFEDKYKKDSTKFNALRILISLFYYEKLFFEKKEEDPFLHNNDFYYLINRNWLNEFKEYYNYKGLYNSLYSFSNKNTHINLNNLDDYINKIIPLYIDSYQNKEISIELMNIRIEPQANIAYIITEKIMFLINKLGNAMNTQIKRKIIGQRNNNYYLMNYRMNNHGNILIGNIINNFLFITKYNINYISSQIFNQEISLLLGNRIEDYIKYRNCNNYNTNKQILKTDNNEIIGELTVFQNEKQNKFLSPYKNNKNNENEPIDNNRLNNHRKIELNQKLSNYHSPIIQNRMNLNIINASKRRQNNISPKNNMNCNISNESLEDIINNSEEVYSINPNEPFKKLDNMEIKLKKPIKLNGNIANGNNGLEYYLNPLRQEINKLKMINSNKDNENNNLKNKYQNLLNQIGNRDNDINNLKSKYKNLLNQLENRNNEIKRLQSENNELKKMK